MVFYQGKFSKVFISTEHTLSGISQSVGSLSVANWTTASLIANFIAPPLRASSWAGTESDATGSVPARARRITNVEGIDTGRLGKEYEDLELLGRTTIDHIAVREVGEITVTRLADQEGYAMMFHEADRGQQDGAIFNSTAQLTTDSGYRVYFQVSSATGSGHVWVTMRNSGISEWSARPAPNKTIREVITFRCEMFDIRQQPYFTVTADTEL